MCVFHKQSMYVAIIRSNHHLILSIHIDEVLHSHVYRESILFILNYGLPKLHLLVSQL